MNNYECIVKMDIDRMAEFLRDMREYTIREVERQTGLKFKRKNENIELTKQWLMEEV